MKIGIKKIKDVAVFTPKGESIFELGDHTLSIEINKVLDAGIRKILINLKEVAYINSSGIGELVSSYTSINNRTGVLKLCGLSSMVENVLGITRLIQVFEVYESEENALSAFD